VKVNEEGDDEGVESDGEGDLEKVESSREGDVGKVQADGEGVSVISIEVDEDIGMESGGHISLGSTGEDNDSEVATDEYAGDFATSGGVDNVVDEYAGYFATSDGLDNVAAARSGVEEDGNETEVWDSDEHGSLVGSDEDEKNEDAIIKDHPKMKLREIQRRCSSEMHVNVTIDCCYRAKKIVKDKMAGNHKEEFGLLWDYAHELRYYVCFDTLKRGWKARCRPLIRLDGCFLKGSFKNEFLTAVRRDANNQMFPIAWVVVEVECTDSWAWFLSLLSTDLGLEDGYGYTIISDQQKGFEIVISDILPRVEHRNCARHVFANWSGKKLGKSYESLENRDKDAYDNLMKKSPKIWIRAFLETTCKSDIVDNNLCEAFNSSIVEARFKSIIRMLEDIRTKMMTRIVQKRKLCNGWKQNYGPLVKTKFDANKKDCVEWQLIWSGENICELRKGSYQYTVNLSQRICSYRSWQISGIPCSHGCATMYHLGLQPDEYLHEYYHNDTYKKAYCFPTHPINEPHDWEKTGIQPVLPPIERKMLRRPKKNRRMAKDEPKKMKPGHLRR
ncbi:hypothetical protein Goklo_023942, partial [Gossypium klotzschianum]|nr:hypothetical protein [Gossypium klotzschianum]